MNRVAFNMNRGFVAPPFLIWVVVGLFSVVVIQNAYSGGTPYEQSELVKYHPLDTSTETPTPVSTPSPIPSLTSTPTKKSVIPSSTPAPISTAAPTPVITTAPTPQYPQTNNQILPRTYSTPSAPTVDYSIYYNNSLKYFSDTESCYNKAVTEAKAGNFVSMSATVDQCKSILSNANTELRKLNTSNLSRIESNLGSAWGYYLYALDGMWTLETTFGSDFFQNDLQNAEKAISSARDYVEGAKKEWDAASK